MACIVGIGVQDHETGPIPVHNVMGEVVGGLADAGKDRGVASGWLGAQDVLYPPGGVEGIHEIRPGVEE